MIQGPTIDWKDVKRVLVVRLRSIGDTVLITPTLSALRRHLPDAKIDVLLEDWVAPILDGFDAVDDVLSFSKSSKRSRFAVAREIRRRKYDVAINLHGGTTSTFFVRVSGAPHRVGYGHYRYKFLYNHLLTSSADFWRRPVTHSAEQHLALVGSVGIPVEDRPKTSLAVTESAVAAIDSRLRGFRDSGVMDSRIPDSGIPDSRFEDSGLKTQDSKFRSSDSDSDLKDPKSKIQIPKSKIAMFHPVAAFATKQWATEKFARVAEFLDVRGYRVVAVGAPTERGQLELLKSIASSPIEIFSDLALPEITALAARASLFVGNDSGIAHIASAVGCPSVVIFGSSNRDHWRPWTDAPHRIVYEPFDCQPCAGYRCEKYVSPRCIESVGTASLTAAIESLLS
ncbi:MAG: glycosyltransferase family 9 protein [Acidobacteria bacterium]|nr:glycosyltransferase family 9 protein [Acidobacteriota bacterium]